ncbi:MAG: sulfotransferase family protein [Geminicoccaceae bacterium]
MPRQWVHGPNLFIVGAPKCGTTSMAAYLDQHPDIYFAQRKEPFFFCSDLPHAKAVTDEEDYLGLFERGKGKRYRGEGSTWYLYSKKAPTAIKKASPDARIIIMLRDPIDLIVAQFQYNVINGNENIEEIEKALDAEPERLAGRLIPPSNRIAAALHYTALVDFAPQIQRYWDLFGKDRVHVILFDQLKQDTEGAVRKSFDFLDLPSPTTLDLTPENETSRQSTRRFTGLYRAMVTKRGLMGQAKRVLPEQLKNAVWKVMDGLNRTPGKPPTKLDLPPAVRAALAVKLRPGVDQLARMLDVDLSQWAHLDPGSLQAKQCVMRAGT